MKHFEEMNNERTIENDPIHFVWHKDSEDRKIILTSGSNWFIQVENDLPKKINKGDEFFIQKETWHRVFCLTDDPDDLIFKITYLS